MPAIPFTTLSPKLPRWGQWVVVGVSLVLAVVYSLAPQRPLAALWQGAVRWLVPSGAAVQLVANPELGLQARPLAAFGPVMFLGCDLAATGSQVWLVTHWQVPAAQSDLVIQWRFIQPDGGGQTTVQQPLDAAEVQTGLPAWYFAGRQPGQAWLRLLARATSEPLALTHVSLPQAVDGSLRVCG